MLEELSPELFAYELYDSGGPLLDTWEIQKYAIGWCDATRLQVRPKSSEFVAIMLEFPDGQRIWFHWYKKCLKSLEKGKARIEAYERRRDKEDEERRLSFKNENVSPNKEDSEQ